MLSILHRYVLWELVRSFVVSFAVLVGMMLLASLYKPLRLGLSLGDLGRLIPYMLPQLYSLVIPASLLSACVMAYGRLSADNELKAVCASGIPLRYVCYPALVLGLVLTALAVPLNDTVQPLTSLMREREMRRVFMRDPFRVSLLGAEMTSRISGYKIYVESRDGDMLRNVVVIEPQRRERGAAPKGAEGEESPEVRVYRAEKARYAFDRERRRIRIEFQNAEVVRVLPGRSARKWQVATADEQVKDIPVADMEEAGIERRSNLTTAQLHQKIQQLRRDLASDPSAEKARYLKRELARATTEVRLREALAFSTLALCCVGVPLGMWMRRQSRLASFAIGIVLFTLLYAMILGGKGLAMEQRLPPAVALWTPDALMAALGMGLLLRTFRY